METRQTKLLKDLLQVKKEIACIKNVLKHLKASGEEFGEMYRSYQDKLRIAKSVKGRIIGDINLLQRKMF